jgi:VCBS repeat-containing protein
MAKTYKILLNDGKGTDIQPVRVVQGAGANGEPVRVLAKRGWRFELQDDLKGKSVAPDQVRVKRVGKSLTLMFDGSQRADVVIEDYYAENTDKDKDNGMPKLVGTAENGGMYEYVPQDPAVSSMPAELKDGNTPVIVALGGGPLGDEFVLSALPLVAAAGGVSGWLVAGGVAAAAAASGGGGGGGGAVVVPSKATGLLTQDAANDTGISDKDSITKNQNPTYSGVADKGAAVEVTVNGVVYKTTASAKDGSYSIALINNGKPLDDGVYTPSIKVSNATGGTITSDGAPFTIDHATDKNQDATKSPTAVVDENSGVVVTIGSIDDASATTTVSTGSKDTGTSKTDFITSDGTLTFAGIATGFKTNGDVVRVQVVKADGSVVQNQYVTPDGEGVWSINNQTQTLATGDYIIKASIEDLAGNVVRAAVDQPLTIAGANVLVAKDDTATVIENQTVTADVKKGVLANDGDTTVASIKVSSVQGSARNVGAVVQGKYGQLQLFTDGHYQYTETDLSIPAGVHETDMFNYEVQPDGITTRVSKATLSIDITGVNNFATISMPGGNLRFITDGTGADASANNAFITVDDKDKGESIFKSLSTSAKVNPPLTGQNGALVMTTDMTTGQYGWSYTKSNNATHKTNVVQHDLFTFESFDGTAKTTLDFKLKQTSTTVTKHEAYGQAGTLDMLDFSDQTQQLTLDFTQATQSTTDTLLTARSVERVDITGGKLSTGTANNTIKLDLSSLLQTDTFDGANHRLYINGDTGDTVIFNSSSNSSTAIKQDSAARAVDGCNYWVYHINNDELLIQNSIANITVNG